MREGLANHSCQAGALEVMLVLSVEALVAAKEALKGDGHTFVSAKVARAIESANELLARIKAAEDAAKQADDWASAIRWVASDLPAPVS